MPNPVYDSVIVGQTEGHVDFYVRRSDARGPMFTINKVAAQSLVDQLAKIGIEPTVSYKTEQTVCFKIEDLPSRVPYLNLDPDLDLIEGD